MTNTPHNSAQSFPERVREVVRSIREGCTMSYGEVAERAGAPRAARAVGTVLKSNYDATVPCHRVIRANGDLGEYNRGKEVKRQLLAHEQAGATL